MAESYDAPDLLNIFTKIVCDKQEYCYVCLRTSDERRLVKPKAFKNFVYAAKVKTNRNILSVCHICERQASNAVRLFQAAVFASSLSLILTELCKIDKKFNQNVLEKKFFTKILNQVKLSKHLTPKVITEEIVRIRKNYDLAETETLVMDNKQVYESVSTPTVVASHLQPRAPAPQSPAPLAGGHSPDVKMTPAMPVIKNEISPPQETYVILDDEDDPLHMTSTTIQKEPPINQYTPTDVAHLSSNLVITLDPPSLMTFESLLADHNKLHADYILHPIFLTDSVEMNVPSLSAVILNDCLIFQDSAKLSQHSRPLKINMDIVKESLRGNRQVFIQVYNTFQLPAITLNVGHVATDNNCQNDFQKYKQKKMKIDGAMLHDAFYEKKGGSSISGYSSVKEVTISDITSDMDEQHKLGKDGASKTDWEDKIPMDVISLVDAVDPKAHEVLGEVVPSGCESMRVGNVRSLAHEKGVHTDIIDLC